MAKAVLKRARIAARWSAPIPDERLTELLDRSKATLESIGPDELTIDVTPDRLDLLTEGGLALYLAAHHGDGPSQRSPEAPPPSPPIYEVEVDPSVAPLRPNLSAVVVTAPTTAGADLALIDEAVRFQELLHATVGMDRRLASLGIYPVERAPPPYRYRAQPIEEVSIVPLEGAKAIGGAAFLAEHPLSVRYGALGSRDGQILTLRDGAGHLMSVPPIVNARPHGEVRPGDRTVLIESTGRRAARVEEAVGLLSLVFRSMGWSARPVTVRSGADSEDGRRLVDGRTVRLTPAALRTVKGSAPTDPAEVTRALARSGLTARHADDGWTVHVPPHRPDLLQEVDLCEEVLLGEGLDPSVGRLPPSSTRGDRGSERRFHRTVGELLLGMGFTEEFSTVLVGGALTERIGRTTAIAVDNPVSEGYDHLRDSLEISLLAALARHVRSGYPQRLYEIGPVVVRDSHAETGARTAVHAAAVLAEERSGFAEAAAIVDALTGAFGATGVREPLDVPGTIPGRSASVRIAGEPIGEVGEIAPRLLDEARVPVPVSWLEVDLTRLWPLVRRGPTR